jgi:diacylglycerol kinase family enzyme
MKLGQALAVQPTRFEVVMNAGSGRRTAAERRACIEEALGERGVGLHLVQHPRELGERIDAAIEAARAAGGAVVAAGGDGTINAVVQRVLGSGLPFSALPQGTFNFFGRNQGLSEDLRTAARGLLDVELREVQVGRVNDRVFLINASLGLYRRLLQDRERAKQQLGRSRLVALWAGLLTLLRPHPRLSLLVRQGGGQRRADVLTLVAGNNRLQLELMGVGEASSVEQGVLLGLMLPPQSRAELLMQALRGLSGSWSEGGQVENFLFDSLTVQPLGRGRRALKIAIDGEVLRLRPPLEFSIHPTPLPLLVPRRGAALSPP